MTHIKAEISTRKKSRNNAEWRAVPTVTACGVTVEGDGMLMPKLAQALIDAGKPPLYTLSAFRGGMECLKPQTLENWASGKVGKGEQPAHLRRGGL